MNWLRVTNEVNIPVREGRSVQLADREIAIFNLGDRFAAIDAACPHRGGPLCDGIVTGTGAPVLDYVALDYAALDCAPTVGHAVVCPLHGWKIDLQTGEVLKPDVSVRVETYDVRVSDGVVEVAIPAATLSQSRNDSKFRKNKAA